jgi:hypothetical protein
MAWLVAALFWSVGFFVLNWAQPHPYWLLRILKRWAWSTALLSAERKTARQDKS